MNAPAAPDDLIDSLRRRLAAQALWRSGLFFIPPLLAAWYIVFFLYRFAWLGPDAVMATGASFLVAAAGLTAARFYRRAPSRLGTARLVDEKADGKERFVTLATIGDSGSAEFISRLRAEAAALARRIDFKRDFPFRGERSILNSLIAALAAVIVFQLSFEWLPAWTPAPAAKLGAAAKKLAQEPRFADLAADISAAAQKLRQRSLSAEEKQAIARDIQNKIEERIAAEKTRGGDVASLEAVANQIRETKQETARIPWLTLGDDAGGGSGKGAGGRGQGSGAGQDLDAKDGLGKGKDQAKGEVSTKALDPSRQKKEEPQSAVQGEKPSEHPDYLIKDGSQVKPGGKSAEEEKKRGGEGGEMKHLSGAKGEPRDYTQGSGISGDKAPARLGAPGEKISGELNEKDLRYVIVQLPEADDGGASGSREAQRGKLRQPAPSANVPLARPDDPKAAGEKQMLPLEYRGLIR